MSDLFNLLFGMQQPLGNYNEIVKLHEMLEKEGIQYNKKIQIKQSYNL